MKRLLTAALAATALAGAAHAQDRSASMTLNFTQLCIAEAQGRIATPAVPCACGVGVLGGAMSQPRYELMGRLIQFGSDQAAIGAEINRIVAEGTPATEIQAAAGDMQAAAGQIGRVCGVLEQQGVLPVAMRQDALAENGFAGTFVSKKASMVLKGVNTN